MEQTKKTKIEIRRAPNALKVILIVLILFSIAALAALRWVHNGISSEIQKMKDEAAAVEFANQQLTEKKGSQVVRHQTLTLTCVSSNLTEAAIFVLLIC